MLGRINRGIDSSGKRLDPMSTPARCVNCVNLRVGASEKDNSTANNRRHPDFSFGRSFPQLASGMPVECIDLAVIASKQNSVLGKRRRGMHLTGRLKSPFGGACDHVDGVYPPVDRGHI